MFGDAGNFESRLDDIHRDALSRIPPELTELTDIASARASLERLLQDVSDESCHDGVTTRDLFVPSARSDTTITIRVYRPTSLDTPLPMLYWIHGGGMVMGSISSDDSLCRSIALEVGCLVASVEYRLAPEQPFPAQIDDCYTGLVWLINHHDEVGIDCQRIAVGGASAGGGLAASLALLVRDREAADLLFQLLIYPMLDDRNLDPASPSLPHPRVWNRAANCAAWTAFLGDAVGTSDVSSYAAASRATDLSRLPPAYIAVGELDLFLEEDVAYATRLIQHGNSVELHVYPGAFHGSDVLVPDSPQSQRWNKERNAALERAFKVGRRR